MKRRSFITLIGGGVVLGAGYALRDRLNPVPSPASAPWREAGNSFEIRRKILSYAILAPNPHNLQPWRADLRQDGVITIWHDPARMLPETDPFSRQLVIGHGCFLETAAIAAREFGIELAISAFPQGEPTRTTLEDRPIARIELKSGGQKDRLFDAITRRFSAKVPFEKDRPVAAAAAAQISAAAVHPGCRFTITSDVAEVAALRQALGHAMELELRTPPKLKESIELVRVGYSEIVANPDGIDLGGPFFEIMNQLGQMSRASMLDTSGQAFMSTVDRYWAMANTTSTIGWLTTQGNDRQAQIMAGRVYQRLALTCATLGVALHPMSQALQEYDEMSGLQRRVLGMLKPAADEQVQMLLRLGYADRLKASPRRAVERIMMV